MGFFSGIVDERDQVRTGGYPAPFRRLLGLRIEELHPLREDEKVACVSEALGRFEGSFRADHLRAEGAEGVATIESGDLAGVPVVLRNAAGPGAAWYVATRPDERALARACAETGVGPTLPGAPPGVEAVRRAELLFVLNYRETPVEVTLDGPYAGVLGAAALRRMS